MGVLLEGRHSLSGLRDIDAKQTSTVYNEVKCESLLHLDFVVVQVARIKL